MQKPSPFSHLNRARFWTRMVMVWERLLPGLFPYVLFALLVAVAGQWGLFLHVPVWAHIATLAAGFVAAFVASVRGLLRFRLPDFVELHHRIAVDNELKPERILAMRHEVEQPSLRVGKAKAGIAASDPFALRYVAVVAAVLGFMILGPVPLAQVKNAFCPLSGTTSASAGNLHLAQK